MTRAGEQFMRWMWLLATMACGSSGLPAPPYVSQASTALTLVPFPPPPARVETVPPRPSKNATWIDGEWTWRSTRWLWARGRWVLPPAGARYSPWTLTHARDGKIYEARGVWHNARGEEIDAPAPLAVADVSGGGVVDTSGDTLAPGRTLPAPGTPHQRQAATSQGAIR